MQEIQGVSGSKEEAVRLLKTMPRALVVCVQREENTTATTAGQEGWILKCMKAKPEQGEQLEHRNESLKERQCLCVEIKDFASLSLL